MTSTKALYIRLDPKIKEFISALARSHGVTITKFVADILRDEVRRQWTKAEYYVELIPSRSGFAFVLSCQSGMNPARILDQGFIGKTSKSDALDHLRQRFDISDIHILRESSHGDRSDKT